MNLPGFQRLSRKRMLIDKANNTIIAATAMASVLVVVSLVASNSLLSQNKYQQRVIKERKIAEKRLKENVIAAKALVSSYSAFDQSPESVLGTKDSNAKITLDALPSKYDFPALTTSLEKILTNGGYTIQSISGSDQEATAKQNSNKPVPTEIPFEITVSASYDSIKKLVADFERSIRPFPAKSIQLSGSDSVIKLDYKGATYYQPEKNLDISTKVIK